MKIEELMDEGQDAAGARITDIYAKRPPSYAIYRTEQRVAIHWADDLEEAHRQATIIAPLNPLRGEINGLIDGWRISRFAAPVARAKLYDRRIADALGVALQQDTAGSLEVLKGIKTDIVSERISSARLAYLLSALVASVLVILLVWVVVSLLTPATTTAWLLWFSLAGGTIGAFFSIAIAIRSRTVLPDFRWADNAADAVLRIVIGAIAASVLITLVKLGAVDLGIGQGKLTDHISESWLYALILSFIAGFSERMIPDLLEKTAGNTMMRTPPPAPPAPPVSLAEQPSAASAGATAEKTKLQGIQSDIQAGRQIIGAIKTLGVGSQLLTTADNLAGNADQILGTIDKALQGGAGGSNLANVTSAAAQVLAQLGDAGLPGSLGGAASVLNSVMKVASPALAGLAGGPVGVVAGLVTGGLQVLSDERKFNAWKTALLAKPFDRTLLPKTVDGNTALLILELAPLMAKRLDGAPPNVATELLRAAITPEADGNPRSTLELAQELLGEADPLGLKARFASVAELTEALDEYRAGAIFNSARDELAGQIAIPALAGKPATSVDMGTLLTGALKLREDPRAGEAFEKIVYVVQALGALHLDPTKLSNLVLSGLEAGAAMMGSSRTTEDPRNANT